MPYRSAAQRAWMHIHHPRIAARWDRKYGKFIRPLKPSGRSPRKK
jgi:hypothetical protein